MSEKKKDPAGLATEMLEKKLAEWRDGAEPVWRSAWPVFERLIARRVELTPVWNELWDKKVTGITLWNLTEQCIFASITSEKGEHAQLWADYRELQALNKDIADAYIELARLTERRDELLNRSGHFHVEHMFRLTDIIDAAGSENYLYRSYIRPELQKLDQYGLKYWPDVPALLRAAGEERPDVEFRDEASKTIALGRPSQRTDFLRELFDRIHDLKSLIIYGLQRDFRLSDESLATLCNVLCDLQEDAEVDGPYIKQARQRLRSQGYKAAW
ncbi:hypothetical protein [Pantoea piersonii]|uniref:hypothetical protein n=1 Tax=Pantoea TaxID=53335 RepID=UPI0028AAD48C|nr:hypothetical protein [Pantoea piersonii]